MVTVRLNTVIITSLCMQSVLPAKHLLGGIEGLYHFGLASCQASAYRELGGFKDLPIMEDYELVRRLRKHGPPAIIPHAIQTSGRRWQTVGFLQTTVTNQVGTSC